MPQHSEPTNSALPPSGNPYRFSVSNQRFLQAVRWVTAISTLFLVLPLLFDLHITLEHSDIETLAGIAISLGSIALAIPVFLRDLDQQALFWKQFFFIGIVLILAAFTAALCLVNFSANEQKSLTLFIYFILIVSINLSAWSNRLQYADSITVYPGLMFAFSLAPFACAFFRSDGNGGLIFFLLLLFYGFYLVLILCMAIVLQFNDTANDDERIALELQAATYAVVDAQRHITLNEQDIFLALVNNAYADKPWMLSHERLENALTTLNAVQDPKSILRLSGERYIPKWDNDRYHAQLNEKLPTVIITGTGSEVTNDQTALTQHEKKLLPLLAQRTQLSQELLQEYGYWPIGYKAILNKRLQGYTGIYFLHVFYRDNNLPAKWHNLAVHPDSLTRILSEQEFEKSALAIYDIKPTAAFSLLMEHYRTKKDE